jgi:hypothetical protein
MRCISAMSAPAANARPAPVTITARSDASVLISRTRVAIASSMRLESAFN